MIKGTQMSRNELKNISYDCRIKSLFLICQLVCQYAPPETNLLFLILYTCTWYTLNVEGGESIIILFCLEYFLLFPPVQQQWWRYVQRNSKTL